MVKKLFSLVVAALLSLSLAGAVMADPIEGTVTKVENEGRAVTVKGNDGKEVTLRISGSSTALEGVGDRAEIKEGMKASGEYDPGDRNTASTLKVSK